jgi:hypothetical protein
MMPSTQMPKRVVKKSVHLDGAKTWAPLRQLGLLDT